MDRRSVFSKTAKGLKEATGKTSLLPRDLRDLLKEIDGRTSIDDLSGRLEEGSDVKLLLEAMKALETEGFVRELPQRRGAAQGSPAADEGDDLDFTSIAGKPAARAPDDSAARQAAAARAKAEADAKAKLEAEAKLRAEAEQKARREAEEKTRREAEEKTRREAEEKARREAEEKARREAEEKARREAEEKARREAEEKARREAEERARLEAEVKARREAEEKARREAEEKARREAEEKARREVEERLRREAEERARRAAEEKARRDAEEKARREAEEKVRREAEEKARREAEEKARRDAEEKARRDAEEKARREAEEKVRREAEEKARREAEEKARREAEEKARREAEEKARREVEEKARREAEEKARREAEEKARLEAEEKARREAEEKARREAEEKARREAEEKARREAEEKARREAEEKARREAEDKPRRDAEEKARKEADEQRRKLEAERARKEAEERIRGEVERKLREEGERRSREAREREQREKARAAEEQARRDKVERERQQQAKEEEARRRESEEKARREAEARREKELKAREEADRTPREQTPQAEKAREESAPTEGASSQDVARRFQERLAAEQRAKQQEAERKREAEAQARRERERAEEAERAKRRREEDERRRIEEEEEERRREEEARAREEEEKARAEAQAAALARHEARVKELAVKQESAAETLGTQPTSRGLRNWGRRIGLIILLLLVAGVIAVNFVPLDASSFEKAATARFGVPVKIGSAHLSLAPLPGVRFERVTIGPEGDMKIAVVKANAELGAIFFDEKKDFESLEFEGATVPVSWLAAAIWGKAQSDTLRVERVIGRKLILRAEGLELPIVNVDAKLDAAGNLLSLSAEGIDGKQTFNITMKDGQAAVALAAKVFTLPFPGVVRLEEFTGKGTLTPSELNLSEFGGGALGGYVYGNARLRWGENWSLEGELATRSLNPSRVAPTLVPTGRLEGSGRFSMRSTTPEKLQETTRFDGSFTVQQGTLGFVDITHFLQGSSASGGTTSFPTMTGNASISGGGVQVRQVRLTAGLLNVTGEASVDAEKNLNGRFQVDVGSQARVLSLGGTLSEPQIKRLKP